MENYHLNQKQLDTLDFKNTKIQLISKNYSEIKSTQTLLPDHKIIKSPFQVVQYFPQPTLKLLKKKNQPFFTQKFTSVVKIYYQNTVYTITSVYCLVPTVEYGQIMTEKNSKNKILPQIIPNNNNSEEVRIGHPSLGLSGKVSLQQQISDQQEENINNNLQISQISKNQNNLQIQEKLIQTHLGLKTQVIVYLQNNNSKIIQNQKSVGFELEIDQEIPNFDQNIQNYNNDIVDQIQNNKEEEIMQTAKLNLIYEKINDNNEKEIEQQKIEEEIDIETKSNSSTEIDVSILHEETTAHFFMPITPPFKPQNVPQEQLKMELEEKQEIKINTPTFPKFNSEDLKKELANFCSQPQRKGTGYSAALEEDTTADISCDIPQYNQNQTNNILIKQKRAYKKRENSSYFKRKYCNSNSSDNEDEYQQQSSQSQQQQQLYTFIPKQNNNNINKKGDKKNVVKNYTKAFRTFLQNSDENQIICQIIGLNSKQEKDQFLSDWNIFEKEHHYNNKLIKTLLTSQKYQELFTFFLQERARDWLINSQVKDKDSHLEVLKGYLKACQNPGQLDNIVILKSRN